MGRYEYDEEWLQNASDEELAEERENVRQDLLISGSMSEEDANEVYDTLESFDDEIHRRYVEEYGEDDWSSFHWTDANRWEKD